MRHEDGGRRAWRIIEANEMKTRLAASVLILILGLQGMETARGTSVRLVNLPQMVELADRIFWGRCLSAETRVDPVTGLAVIEYSFQVREAIKGVQPGATLVFRQVGKLSDGRSAVSGLPQYRKGQDLLLFLHRDSSAGLTSPVGFSQGTFQPRRRKDGRMGLVNALENRNLVQNVTGGWAQQTGITPQELNGLEGEEPIALEVLRDVILKIERQRLEKATR